MNRKARLGLRSGVIICCIGVLLFSAARAQEPKKAPPKPGPMLADGDRDTSILPNSSWCWSGHRRQLLRFIRRLESQFDFIPGDRLIERSQDGYYHLGDIDIRLRSGEGEWKDYSTALPALIGQEDSPRSRSSGSSRSERRIFGLHSSAGDPHLERYQWEADTPLHLCESHEHPD